MKKVKKSPTAKKNNLFDGAFGEKQKDDQDGYRSNFSNI